MAPGKTVQGNEPAKEKCGDFLRPIRDTLDILSGKWKVPIIAALTLGNMRFKELERAIPKITARMLSKELKELEDNQLVTRTVFDTKPVTVEYELTPYGKSLKKVLMEMRIWGDQHRKRIMGRKRTEFNYPKSANPTEV